MEYGFLHQYAAQVHRGRIGSPENRRLIEAVHLQGKRAVGPCSGRWKCPADLPALALSRPPGSLVKPVIWGDLIVWTDSRNGNQGICLYDLSARTETPITRNTAEQDISGNLIVWADGPNDPFADIYLFTLGSPEPGNRCGDKHQERSAHCFTDLRKEMHHGHIDNALERCHPDWACSAGRLH